MLVWMVIPSFYQPDILFDLIMVISSGNFWFLVFAETEPLGLFIFTPS